VSLLWRKKPLRIGLGPDSIIVSGSREAVRVQGEGAGDWRSAIAALPEVLKNYRNQDASVVLADQFVRYALLPWNAALKSDAEWVALALHRFGALPGAPAASTASARCTARRRRATKSRSRRESAINASSSPIPSPGPARGS
jgi:hypothetical protein